VHNCTIHDQTANPAAQDGGHLATFGLFYSTTDYTAFNIVESNICYHAGHDALSLYGPYNLARCNFVHNEPYYFNDTIQQMAGHRDMEVGGQVGDHCVVENNRLVHAGLTANGGSHSIEVDGPQLNIIRNNVMAGDDYSGLVIYSGKTGWYAGAYNGSNYVYNNTIYNCGWPQRFITNYTYNGSAWVSNSVTDNGNWRNPIVVVWSTNNIFANNLIWSNASASIAMLNGATNILVNQNNLTTPPAFVDPTDGGAWSQTQPDCHLQAGSAMSDAGTWLTAVTSSSGSGTSFTVGDPNFFFAGMTAAGHTVPGDTIQLQGQSATATIAAISGNTITVNSSLTWTNGQGVALPYSGSAPDVGAFEYSATGGTTTSSGGGAWWFN
jgi:hypothetical protein